MPDLRDALWQRTNRSFVPILIGVLAVITVSLAWRSTESWSSFTPYIGLLFGAFVLGLVVSGWLLERKLKNSVLLPRYLHDVEYEHQHFGSASAADFEFPKDARRHWKILLCHASRDTELVRDVAEALGKHGITSLTDSPQIRLGIPLERAATSLLEQLDAVVLFIGPEERPWQDLELRAILTTAVQQERPVIPVFLPGVNPQQARPTLPIFLRDFSWLELSGVDDLKAIESLAGTIAAGPVTGRDVRTQIEG